MSNITSDSELSEFFESFPLYKPFHYDVPPNLYEFPRIALKKECKNCKSSQTFNLTTNGFTNSPVEHNRAIPLNHSIGITEAPKKLSEEEIKKLRQEAKMQFKKIIHLRFRCDYCKEFEYDFLVKIDGEADTLTKVGQFPPWDISINKDLKNILGEFEPIYKKGLINESQSYGIGAYAYYRRITENIIDDLLDLVPDLMSQEEKEKYLPALNETKKTRVVEQKIELVMDLLPPILKPPNFNPLKLLYKILSEGLHNKTDEECLEVAKELRTILTFLISQIMHHREETKEFTESMKKILDKRN